MKVASHQPAFLPWAGFWHKVAAVDHFVLSAGVQYAKDSYLNRCNHAGTWITLPTNAKDTTPIVDVLLVDPRRLKKATIALTQVSGFFKWRLGRMIETMATAEEGTSLRALNTRLINDIGLALGLKTTVHTHIGLGEGSNKTERLLSRIKDKVPAVTAYYSGQSAVDYLDPALLNGLALYRQVQVCKEPVPSILQLIAQHEKPMEYIHRAFSWERVI